MGSVNVKETRRQLKTLLDRVEAGETIAIARRGEVVAKLVPRHAAHADSLHSARCVDRSGGKDDR